MEPGAGEVVLDDDYLDDIAAAFGQVVDSKSPFTSGHSERVAGLADTLARRLGIGDARRRWLRRGALLHDVGKLGVSNAILDKPGQLDDEEWASCGSTPRTPRRSWRASAPSPSSRASPARTTSGSTAAAIRAASAPTQIALETRIITTADIFDAHLGRPPLSRRGADPADAGDDGASRSAPRSTRSASRRCEQVIDSA